MTACPGGRKLAYDRCEHCGKMWHGLDPERLKQVMADPALLLEYRRVAAQRLRAIADEQSSPDVREDYYAGQWCLNDEECADLRHAAELLEGPPS